MFHAKDIIRLSANPCLVSKLLAVMTSSIDGIMIAAESRAQSKLKKSRKTREELVKTLTDYKKVEETWENH